MSLFWKPSSPAVREFLEKNRRKEPYLGWIAMLFASALMALASMVFAALLFAGINSWSPMKVPLWILLLPPLFATTLWVQGSMDLDTRSATLRAIINTIATILVALFVQYFLNHAFSDRILADGSAARRLGSTPFWATLVVTWVFVTCSELRIDQVDKW